MISVAGAVNTAGMVVVVVVAAGSSAAAGNIDTPCQSFPEMENLKVQ